MAILEWRANLSLRLTPSRVSLTLTKIFMHDTTYTVFSITDWTDQHKYFGKIHGKISPFVLAR